VPRPGSRHEAPFDLRRRTQIDEPITTGRLQTNHREVTPEDTDHNFNIHFVKGEDAPPETAGSELALN
jgi:hypothetical protein